MPEKPSPARIDHAFYFEDYEPDQELTSSGRTVTDADIRMYLGATGTDHPNHTDEEYCRQHPILEGVCAPGVLVLGIVDAAIAARVTQHMVASMNYGHERVRYLKPVYVGDTIHTVIRVRSCTIRNDEWGLVRLEATAINQKDDPVVFDSHLLVVQRRPVPKQRAATTRKDSQ